MATRKFKIKIEGKIFEAEVEEIGGELQTPPKKVKTQQIPVQQPVHQATGNAIVAPMPGKVIKIGVTKGQQVKSGDVVLILEAMKMEQEIRSNQEGAVADIPVSEGDTVKKEQALIIFK